MPHFNAAQDAADCARALHSTRPITACLSFPSQARPSLHQEARRAHSSRGRPSSRRSPPRRRRSRSASRSASRSPRSRSDAGRQRAAPPEEGRACEQQQQGQERGQPLGEQRGQQLGEQAPAAAAEPRVVLTASEEREAELREHQLRALLLQRMQGGSQ